MLVEILLLSFFYITCITHKMNKNMNSLRHQNYKTGNTETRNL